MAEEDNEIYNPNQYENNLVSSPSVACSVSLGTDSFPQIRIIPPILRGQVHRS